MRTYDPLDQNFNNKTIDVRDFADPAVHAMSQQVKAFNRCIIRGPGIVYFGRTDHRECRFDASCQAITIADGVAVSEVAIFPNAVFTECLFSKITLLMSKASAAQFASGAQGLRWLDPGGPPKLPQPMVVPMHADESETNKTPDGGAAS